MADPTARLRINPIACNGVGICTHLAASLITVDSWGYPIVATRELNKRERKWAQAAAAACPRQALFIEESAPVRR